MVSKVQQEVRLAPVSTFFFQLRDPPSRNLVRKAYPRYSSTALLGRARLGSAQSQTFPHEVSARIGGVFALLLASRGETSTVDATPLGRLNPGTVRPETPSLR